LQGNDLEEIIEKIKEHEGVVGVIIVTNNGK
jgi:hypothetical protein